MAKLETFATFKNMEKELQKVEQQRDELLKGLKKLKFDIEGIYQEKDVIPKRATLNRINRIINNRKG